MLHGLKLTLLYLNFQYTVGHRQRKPSDYLQVLSQGAVVYLNGCFSFIDVRGGLGTFRFSSQLKNTGALPLLQEMAVSAHPSAPTSS